jgi:hypothetical protein
VLRPTLCAGRAPIWARAAAALSPAVGVLHASARSCMVASASSARARSRSAAVAPCVASTASARFDVREPREHVGQLCARAREVRLELRDARCFAPAPSSLVSLSEPDATRSRC